MDTDGYIGIMGTDGYNYLGIAEKDGICPVAKLEVMLVMLVMTKDFQK